MSGYWYVGPAPDGRRFCWAKTPTFECPISVMASDARREGGEISNQILAAAARLSVDPKWLAMRVAGAGHGRKRVDDKLTDRCHCGARMDRLGYGFWVERPANRDEQERAGTRVSRALFGPDAGGYMYDGEMRYADTKKEAEQWARDELKIAREAA